LLRMRLTRPGQQCARLLHRHARMRIQIAAALSIGLFTAILACREPEPVSPAVGLTQAVVPPQFPLLDNYPEREITIHLYVASGLRNKCAGPDPFFHFDSDKVTPQDQAGLLALATCMKTGALKDSRIRLVGRADPRGTVPYNEKLGLERAERVRAFLVSQGVASFRLDTASIGKMGAEPGEDQWGTDRRVDIELAP
jgi:outer membrane protein OmpA-like peptidoglycan-associated protein